MVRSLKIQQIVDMADGNLSPRRRISGRDRPPGALCYGTRPSGPGFRIGFGDAWALASLIVWLALGCRLAHADLLDQFIAPDVPGTDVQRDVTVASRHRNDADPLGVHLGDFTIRPMLTESTGYENNVTGSRSPHGSPLVETNIDLPAVYDRSRISAAGELTVNDNEYLTQPRQSYTNWTASLSGQYTFGRDILNLLVQHQNLNQTSKDLDVPQLDHPIAYRIDEVRASYRIALDPLVLVPGFSISHFSYDNGIVDDASYHQSFRDRTVYNPTLTAGYPLGRSSVVAVVRDAYASYAFQSGAPSLDFYDVSVLGGIDYDATGLLRFRVLAGYEMRNFSSAAYKTIAAPIVEVSAIWNVTGLTTLTAEAARRIEDSADETTVGLTELAFSLRVDHELFRNVLLYGSAGYINDQYAGNQGEQTLFSAGAGASYLLNRNMRVSASYALAVRHSSGNIVLDPLTPQGFGPGYSDNRFLLQVRLEL